jgi:membrane protein
MTVSHENNQEMSGASRLVLNTASAWDILRNAAADYRYNGDANMAAAIAFYFILSFIPFIMLTIMLSGLVFGDNSSIRDGLATIIQTFNPYFSGEFFTHFGEIERRTTVLGWVGVILLVWFSSLIFNSAQTSLGIIFRHRRKKKFVISKLMIVAMIVIGWGVIVMIMGITYLTTLHMETIRNIEQWRLLQKSGIPVVFRYILPYFTMLIFFTLVYKTIPTTVIQWRHAGATSFLFTTLAEISKHLFMWYVTSFSQYHLLFGSLTTAMLFIVWIFYLAVIFLFSAEIVSSFLKRDLILLEKAFLRREQYR